MNDNSIEKQKIRVLVVDDHDLVRGKLISMLAHEENVIVVGGACNGREALQKVGALDPHVVLMDVRMPFMNGIEATAEILSSHPQVRILALTQLAESEYVKRMLRSGARGYVLKSYAVEELKAAIVKVHEGGQYISEAIAGEHADQLATEKADASSAMLTPRETEVLRLVASRRSSREIAEILHADVKSIEFHKANLMEKLGARNEDSLVQYAIDHRMLSLDPGANHYEVEHQSR